MSEEIIEAVRKLLTGEKATPLTKRGIIWRLTPEGGKSAPTAIGKALEALVASGEIIAVQGKDIPWNFYDKRAGTYYLGATVWERELKVIADAEAADKRRWAEEFATDEADIAMRELHPVEWRKLFDTALKRRLDGAYKPKEKN